MMPKPITSSPSHKTVCHPIRQIKKSGICGIKICSINIYHSYYTKKKVKTYNHPVTLCNSSLFFTINCKTPCLSFPIMLCALLISLNIFQSLKLQLELLYLHHQLHFQQNRNSNFWILSWCEGYKNGVIITVWF